MVLAKLNLVFLPLGLLTSYFSVQIPQITEGHTTTTYWVAFMIVTLLSLIFMFMIGQLGANVKRKLWSKIKDNELWRQRLGNKGKEE
jgi:cytochrome c biogenesis protein CcdA